MIAGFFVAGLSSPAWAWEPKLPNGVGPTSWYLNGKSGRYFLPLIQGKLLGPTIGVVKTDSNCAPDDQGLSHCYNKIELLSGGTITVQDTHKMSNFRCLYPGERVAVRPNGSSWVIVQTAPQA
jgi:hypothetical protein